MSLSSRSPSCLERTDATKANVGCIHSPKTVDAASILLAELADNQHCSDDGPTQDDYAYYKAFLSSVIPSSSRKTTSPSHDDGVTGNIFDEGTHIAQGLEERQQSRPRGTPYSLAVRFANRSNGAPLATIVEQGSISTLNSHKSHFSIGRFPSIRTVENMSPGRASKAVSISLDTRALGGIEEETRQGIDRVSTIDVPDNLNRRRRGPNQVHNVGTSAQPTERKVCQPEAPEFPEIEHDFEYNGLRGFIRGILGNVRGRSRSRSHSSSITDIPEAHASAERRLDPGHFSPHIRQPGAGIQEYPANPDILPVSASTECSGFSASTPFSTPVETHATSRKVVDASELSAGVYPPNLHLPPPSSHQNVDARYDSSLLPPMDLSSLRNGKEAASTVHSVPPGPREQTPGHVLANATTTLYVPRRSRDELSAPPPPHRVNHGVSFYRLEASSSRDVDRARDTSQNPSFCSTMSTSYSGTVLGVDLDLQHEFPHASARRSFTPVWFTPIDSQESLNINSRSVASILHGPKEATLLPPRSLTSSALSALLPVAAAEGIVKPNFKTPQLSFFSPSGNLIQTEDRTSPRKCRLPGPLHSHYPGTPTTSTSYYKNANTPKACDALAAALRLPPARPAPVPMITPPQSSAPLPYHLRYHHNYQHAEQSQITADESHLEPTPPAIVRAGSTAVKGCGGLIRRESPTPSSGIPFTKPSKSERSMSCLFLGEARRSRFNILSRSSWPCPSQKGKTLKKRCRNGIGTGTATWNEDRREGSGKGSSRELGVGPIAGHAMRVCFCQPYDGAGKPGCGILVGGHCHSEACARRKVRDSMTPNARIVDEREAAAVQQTKGVSKGSTDGQLRTRSDSGVSTGVAVRVSVVGA